MITTNQKEVYTALPNAFNRKDVLGICSRKGILRNSGISYLHQWYIKGWITRTSPGEYVKVYDNIDNIPSKELTPITKKMDTGHKKVLEPAEPDCVLTADFSLKSSTDEELLAELVSRGYSWEGMKQTIVRDIPYPYTA